MLKRFWSIIMCLALVFSLAACGGNEEENNSSSESEVSSSTDIELPDYKPTSDKIVELTEGDPSLYDDPTNWAYYLKTKLKEVYGVEIECIRTTHQLFATKAAQLVLSDQSPDLMQYREQDDPTFIKNGIVQPVDDLFDFSQPVFEQQKDLQDDFRYSDGKLYTFMRAYRNEGYCYYFLEDLEEAGLETPRELYYKGEWTWSKFLEYAKALTVKASDGSVSRYGAAVDNSMHAIVGESFVKYNNGVYTNNLRSSKLADFWNSYSKATFEDKIFEASTDITTSFNSHTISIALSNRKMFENHINEDLWDAGAVSFAPTPKWDNADAYYVPAGYGSHWIAANAPNPQGAAAYFAIHCYLYYGYDEAYNEFNHQSEIEKKHLSDEDFKLVDQMLTDTETFKLVAIRDEGLGTNWSNGQRLEMVRGITQYNQSWATLVEKYYPLLNSAIEETK